MERKYSLPCPYQGQVKIRYGENYIVDKLHIILFAIVLTAIMNKEESNANTDIEDDIDNQD